MNNLPEMTPEQLAAASRKAACERKRVAEQKRLLKIGALTVEQFMSNPQNARVRVRQMLEALPGIGRTGAERAMLEFGIAPNRRVGGLGSRQRERIIGRFS